ncbi:methylmalonyl Co-A mutase-associated GTPase MeaB [Desulfatibacillum aliphaticivorans]|uniref:methylmalonyl Co-A mutase-associated GTPase MeaB n=1 Tax=Desulfatibacillum aliphaticivorans TaxID=218208 RepID=UPI00041F6CA4|nr:methylmalonyl Co-A mutase-associated GTPase MeaB [Desulfatibacillum aliphaticivorans]
MPRRLPVEKVIELIEKRDVRGLSKGVSMIEDGGEDRNTLLKHAKSRISSPALSIGFTGPGGVGKSTLINSVIKKLREFDKHVGVIAVDPTSPYTGGAVLGDRIRMFEHSNDDKVFIRSLSTQDAMGGICEAAKHALNLYKAFDFDVILLETIGVGQDEVDVSIYADITLVVFAPGFGDIMQACKAGIMEIADIFVVNKADRPGADALQEYLHNILQFSNGNHRPEIVKTVAESGEGIDQLIAALSRLAKFPRQSPEEKQRRRVSDEIRSFALAEVNRFINSRLNEMAEPVINGDLSSQEASEILLKQLFKAQ